MVMHGRFRYDLKKSEMKNFDANKWARPNIRDLIPYSSARDEFSGEDYIFLDANESPFNSGLNRYPDPYQCELKKSIAELKGCSENQLFLGNGSDEAIDLLIRCFAEPGKDRILSIAPSYGMYMVCADINGIGFDPFLLNSDFSLDPPTLLQSVKPETKLVFLCSPNNPTGNNLDEGAVRQILESFQGLVVVDEAYQDFSAKPGFLPLLEQFSNLVVLQTFSKAWGLAGVRLGMAMADPSVIAYLNKVKYPYNINQLSQDAVLKAIGEVDLVEKKIGMIVAERNRIMDVLQKMPGILKVFSSDANFILIRVADAGEVYRGLLDKGIVVRDRSSMPLCDGCIRITIGTANENKLMLEALVELVESNSL